MANLKRGELKVVINYQLASSLLISTRNIAKKVIEKCDQWEEYLNDVAVKTGETK